MGRIWADFWGVRPNEFFVKFSTFPKHPLNGVFRQNKVPKRDLQVKLALTMHFQWIWGSSIFDQILKFFWKSEIFAFTKGFLKEITCSTKFFRPIFPRVKQIVTMIFQKSKFLMTQFCQIGVIFTDKWGISIKTALAAVVFEYGPIWAIFGHNFQKSIRNTRIFSTFWTWKLLRNNFFELKKKVHFVFWEIYLYFVET